MRTFIGEGKCFVIMAADADLFSFYFGDCDIVGSKFQLIDMIRDLMPPGCH
jgi:hypothetical protein